MALVVFLRGVNVGGHKTFRPSMLVKEFADLDVVNIGAAGTFVIRKAVNQATLREQLLRKLPFNTEIMICHGRDLVRSAASDPFVNVPSGSEFVRFVSVLGRRVRKIPSLPITFPSDGEWLLKVISIDERFLFGIHRRHMKVIRYLGQLDKLCGGPVTTRSWNTINSIVKLLV